MSGAEPVTEYPELTEPVDADELYIIDKSDLTESDEGTSKRVSRKTILAQPFGLITQDIGFRLDILITSTVLFVPINPDTTVDPATTGFSSPLNKGDLKYDLAEPFEGLLELFPTLECTSGTVGIEIQVFKNGLLYRTFGGDSEQPVDAIPHPVIMSIDLVQDDVITAKVRNQSNTANLRCTEYSLKVTNRYAA